MSIWSRVVQDFPEPGESRTVWVRIPDLGPGDQVRMSHDFLLRLLVEAGYSPVDGPDSVRRRDADAPPAP